MTANDDLSAAAARASRAQQRYQECTERLVVLMASTEHAMARSRRLLDAGAARPEQAHRCLTGTRTVEDERPRD